MRILLKSWAIPPARVPMASIFCDCRNCSSNFTRSVTSLATAYSPTTSSLLSLAGRWIGVDLTSIKAIASYRWPADFVVSFFLNLNCISWPLLISRVWSSTGSMAAAFSRSSSWRTCLNRDPIKSCRENPSTLSNWSFRKVKRPWLSKVKIRSGELLTMYSYCLSDASSLADTASLSAINFFLERVFLTIFIRSENSNGFLR